MFWNKKKYDFYIAGPMRGYKDLNKPMFACVSVVLRRKGFTVWSPSEHESYLKLSFSKCMIVDLNAVINQCNKVVLLPGWRNSLGANMEVFTAFGCGKEVVEIVIDDVDVSFDFVPVDVSEYTLPYKLGQTDRFDPHKCELDSFIEK